MRRLRGRQVYLDSHILIYCLDGDPTYVPAVTRILTQVSAGEFGALTGDLSVTEILVHPLARGDESTVARIKAFLATGLVDIRPHTREAFEQAAHVRATRRTSLPDALHVATALSTGCTMLVTNDARMPRVPGLEIVRRHQLEHVDG